MRGWGKPALFWPKANVSKVNVNKENCKHQRRAFHRRQGWVTCYQTGAELCLPPVSLFVLSAYGHPGHRPAGRGEFPPAGTAQGNKPQKKKEKNKKGCILKFAFNPLGVFCLVLGFFGGFFFGFFFLLRAKARPSRPGRHIRRAPGGRRPGPGLPEPAGRSRLRPRGCVELLVTCSGKHSRNSCSVSKTFCVYAGKSSLARTKAGGVSLRG